MVLKSDKKISEASSHLERALALYRAQGKDSDLFFLTVAKAFEVLVEYCWKDLKGRVQDEGLDAPSPKEAVRQATRLGIITNPEKWIDCINARNDSVHDYFSIPKKDYIKLAGQMLGLAKGVYK